MEKPDSEGSLSGPMSRRDVLQRGAVVCGALVWTVPVVQVVSMQAAHAESASAPPRPDDKDKKPKKPKG